MQNRMCKSLALPDVPQIWHFVYVLQLPAAIVLPH
jgi:hypothetical protein